MCDISEQAVEYAKINAMLNGMPHISITVSDGYKNIKDDDFTLILSNPPYHADFSLYAVYRIDLKYTRILP